MMYLYLIINVVLYVAYLIWYTNRRQSFAPYTVVITFYALVALCNLLFYYYIESTGFTFSLDSGIKFELWPFIFIFLCFIILSRPYLTKDKVVFRDNPLLLRIISRVFIVCSIINFVILLPELESNFLYENWTTVYSESQEHVALYNNIFERIVMVYCYYMKIPATIVFFYNLTTKTNVKENYVLALSIVLCIIASVGATASRASLFIGVMIFVLCYFFFEDSINTFLKKRIRRWLIISGGGLLVLFVSISIARYREMFAGSILYYFGHSMITFAFGVVDTIKQFGNGWFFCRSLIGSMPGDFELGTHCDKLFTTIVGSLYRDFGPIYTPLFCLFFSLIIEWFSGIRHKTSKQITLDFAEVTIYFFFLNELLIGAFYMPTSILNWMMIVSIYFLLKLSKIFLNVKV